MLSQARHIEETFEKNIDINVNSSVFKDNKSRNRFCSYCRNPGHIKEECRKRLSANSKKVETNLQNNSKAVSSTNPPISCYGCGNSGFVRSKYPKCNISDTASVEFLSVDTLVDPQPILRINILGHTGRGLIDTAAKQSVASHTCIKF